MNLAAIDWLSISIDLLLVVFVIVCLLMILLILMQRPKQEGLGAAFGAGVTDQVFGARTTNVLQRGTVYLASLFFLLSLALAVLIGHKNKKISMLAPKTPVAKEQAAQPATATAKEKPSKPKSLSTELPSPDAPPLETPTTAAPPVLPPAVTPPVVTPPVVTPPVVTPPVVTPPTAPSLPPGVPAIPAEKSAEP